MTLSRNSISMIAVFFFIRRVAKRNEQKKLPNSIFPSSFYFLPPQDEGITSKISVYTIE